MHFSNYFIFKMIEKQNSNAIKYNAGANFELFQFVEMKKNTLLTGFQQEFFNKPEGLI